MSGGVDSAVSALLLQEQGFEVVGLFMRNWDDSQDSEPCSAEADHADAQRACDKLGIDLLTVDFSREYRERVFEEFLEASRQGLTPNPDVLCNREIKFEYFASYAKKLGATAIGTGHYARMDVNAQTGHRKLLRGLDPSKDQSYFLCQVSQSQFQNVHFPVGHLIKTKVRELAESKGLALARKKDSTGICFIGERNFREFLMRYLPTQPGLIRDIDTGARIGEHSGVAYYTLGQRKGLSIGGTGEPYFIVSKDAATQTLWAGRGESHPALFSQELVADGASWISGQAPQEGPLTCKIRYRQSDQAATLTHLGSGRIRLCFDQPQRAVTPGQAVVLYQGEECLGGAWIRSASGVSQSNDRAQTAS